jgi:hypothetical protein
MDWTLRTGPYSREYLLAKAKEADEEAAKADKPDFRDDWASIAEGYRELANRRGVIAFIPAGGPQQPSMADLA